MNKKEKKSSTKKTTAGRTAPGGPRRRGFAVENLSEEGFSLVNEMLASTNPYYRLDDIIPALEAKTGEKVARSSLGRYYNQVFKKKLREAKEHQQRIIDMTNSILAVIKESGDEDTEALAGRLITTGLFSKVGEIREADPIKLLKEARERKKLDLLEKQLMIENEKLEFLRKKIKEGEIDPSEISAVQIYLPANKR